MEAALLKQVPLLLLPRSHLLLAFVRVCSGFFVHAERTTYCARTFRVESQSIGGSVSALEGENKSKLDPILCADYCAPPQNSLVLAAPLENVRGLWGTWIDKAWPGHVVLVGITGVVQVHVASVILVLLCSFSYVLVLFVYFVSCSRAPAPSTLLTGTSRKSATGAIVGLWRQEDR